VVYACCCLRFAVSCPLSALSSLLPTLCGMLLRRRLNWLTDLTRHALPCLALLLINRRVPSFPVTFSFLHAFRGCGVYVCVYMCVYEHRDRQGVCLNTNTHKVLHIYTQTQVGCGCVEPPACPAGVRLGPPPEDPQVGAGQCDQEPLLISHRPAGDTETGHEHWM
jgi:hypothetical protein